MHVGRLRRRVHVLVLVRTLVRIFLLISIHVRDPPSPLHRPQPLPGLRRGPAVLRPGPSQVLMRDMLARARRSQPRSGGRHGIAPRGAVAVAVSIGRKDEDGGDCGVASQWWRWRRRRWGKGPVINRASSCISRASLPNEGFFGRRPRWPAVLTGLPSTVRVAATVLPAAVGSIDDSRSSSRL